MIDIIGGFVIILGAIAILFGSIAVLVLPNFYSRLLACTQIDTVGMGMVMFGIIIREGINLTTSKIIIAFIFLMVTNPITTHSIGRSAYIRGEKPNKRRHSFEE